MSSGSDIQAVTAVADSLRATAVGNNVTFVVNRNINFTNVCVKRCGFCAFSRYCWLPEAMQGEACMQQPL